MLATGRYQKPVLPNVPGLATFNGKAGAIHTSAYKDPERFRGMRVLVAGCAISALEIASDLAVSDQRVLETGEGAQNLLLRLDVG